MPFYPWGCESCYNSFELPPNYEECSKCFTAFRTTTPSSLGHLCAACSKDAELEKEMPSSFAISSREKDVRTYEHDRQKAKKAAEFAKVKARKGKWNCSCCIEKRDKVKRGKLLLDGGDIDVGEPLEAEPTAGDLGPYSAPKQGGELSLVDVLANLVKNGKPRKSNVGDFEVIPQVRSVIVLDDETGSEGEFGEPWEHIYGDSEEELDEKRQPPSYAEIISAVD